MCGLVTMCVDFATPNANMSSSQNIIQRIDGKKDEGNGKNKRFPVQQDERLEEHQSKRSIVYPDQHFEGNKRCTFLK